MNKEIILSLNLTLVIIGLIGLTIVGVKLFDQSARLNQMTVVLSDTNSRVMALSQKLEVFALDQSTTTQDLPSYCTAPPTVRGDIGGDAYPFAPEYDGVPFGDVFTAATCGWDRLQQMLGEDFKYTWGSHIKLKSAPDASFQVILKDIGFSCTEKTVTDACADWALENDVPVDQILRLKPFIDLIAEEDCVNCG